MKRKYSFTLLEVMIATFLVGIIVAFLFTYFRQTLVRKQQLHTLKEKIMQVELVRLRLTHLFDQLVREKGKIESIAHQDAHGTALLLYCTYGVDPDSCFSKESYCMLYKTHDKRLALCRWDKEKKQTRIDTLLNKVEELSFAFFTNGKWQETWPPKKGEKNAPLMLKIEFKLQGEKELEQTLLFSLTSPDIMIVEKKL